MFFVIEIFNFFNIVGSGIFWLFWVVIIFLFIIFNKLLNVLILFKLIVIRNWLMNNLIRFFILVIFWLIVGIVIEIVLFLVILDRSIKYIVSSRLCIVVFLLIINIFNLWYNLLLSWIYILLLSWLFLICVWLIGNNKGW